MYHCSVFKWELYSVSFFFNWQITIILCKIKPLFFVNITVCTVQTPTKKNILINSEIIQKINLTR